jgi:Fe-coproporphyrin III synthase
MRTPRSIDIEITSRCNLRCAYCYFFDNPEVVYRDLPAQEWLQFFEECGQLGIMQLSLAGGEPFCRKDLRTLLTGIVGNRMRYSLLSNGGLIDDDIAAFIATTNRCDYVQISIDGSKPAIHDACRGQGSWKGAVRGIRTLKRHNVPVSARVTIHRHNVQDLTGIARFLLEDLELGSFGTNAAGYLGACRGNSRSVLLAVDQRQQAMEILLRLDEKYPGRIMAEAGPLAEARMWHQMEKAKAEGTPASADGGRLTGCGCTSIQIAVRADGAIVPCCMLPQMELGRINRDSLAEVWQNSRDLNDLRARSSIPLCSFSYCAGCEYTPYCTGNCPGLAYSLTGNVNYPSPDACFRNFLAIGGTMPLESSSFRVLEIPETKLQDSMTQRL